MSTTSALVISASLMNGGLLGTALYDPWGELLSATGEMATIPANGAFRFQGDLTDSATGQVDMLTRMYESTLGRFSSRDALFGEPTNPVSLNQYLYGAVNPVTYSDPTGMSPECGDCTPEAEQTGIRVWTQAVARNAERQALQAWFEAVEVATESFTTPAVETPTAKSPVPENVEDDTVEDCSFFEIPTPSECAHLTAQDVIVLWFGAHILKDTAEWYLECDTWGCRLGVQLTEDAIVATGYCYFSYRFDFWPCADLGDDRDDTEEDRDTAVGETNDDDWYALAA